MNLLNQFGQYVGTFSMVNIIPIGNGPTHGAHGRVGDMEHSVEPHKQAMSIFLVGVGRNMAKPMTDHTG